MPGLMQTNTLATGKMRNENEEVVWWSAEAYAKITSPPAPLQQSWRRESVLKRQMLNMLNNVLNVERSAATEAK